MLLGVVFQGYYASTPSVGYTIYSATGSVLQDRSTTGIVQPTAGVNFFQVNFNVSPVVTLTNPCTIGWDDGASSPGPNWAYTEYNGSAANTTVVVVNDNLPCGT